MRLRSVLFGAAVWAALAHAVAAAPAAPAQSLDDLVLADVNGEEITRRQLVLRLLEYRGEETLDKMINRTLLLQEAKKQNLTVSDEETKKALAELQAKFKSEKEYREFLLRNRLREEQYRGEMTHTLLIQKVAVKALPITDADLDQYDVRMLTAPDRPTAEKWVKELNNGATFRQLAAERCDDPALRQAGGRLAPFLKIEMLDVARAVDEQKLQPGTYTKTPVQLGSGAWALVRLENRIPVAKTSASERDRLQAAVTTYRVDQWLTAVRGKAAVKKMPLTEAVVATVNGEPVTRAALVARLHEFQGEETLQQMVNRTLLLQSAKKLKVSVSEAEADKKLADFRTGFPKPEQFQAFLTRNSLTEKQLRDELRYTQLMERVALAESPITEQDLVRYDVRMISVPDRATAEKWVKELEDGSDFTRMAGERSQDPQGRRVGGKMKPFLKIEMLDVWRPLQEQALKPGAYTKKPVLLTDGSHVIIKLEGLIPGSSATPEEKARLKSAITRYRVNQWLDQSRARAVVSKPVPLTPAVIRGGK